MILGFKYLLYGINRSGKQSTDIAGNVYKFVFNPVKRIQCGCKRFSSTDVVTISSNHILQSENDTELSVVVEKRCNDSLTECQEDVSVYAPYHTPSFNLAAYVNKSPTLQELVKLGVNLHKIEGINGAAESILKLDFERDIKKYLVFMNDVGVPVDQYGHILTQCPMVLFQPLDNLLIRHSYLESKRFSSDNIVRIFTKNPRWFTWPTQDIDYRLGFFQKNFNLSGDEVRHVSVRMPRLITNNLPHIKLIMFSVKEEMGFTVEESKLLLLNKPKIFTLNQSGLLSRFEYLHNVMKLSHGQITEQPDGLLHRKTRLAARHTFLSSLGRDQYDPLKPGYVSIRALLLGTDVQFCTDVAKSTVQTYNKYLKSL